MSIFQIIVSAIESQFEALAGVVERHPIPAAAVTIASIAVAAWTNQKNRATTIFGHSMQAVTHLDHRWESEDLKAHKRLAAAYLHDCLTEPGTPRPRTVYEEEALTSIFNFLETVGCFVKTGAIAHRLSWQLFGSAAQLYVEGASSQLKGYRNPHLTVYSELQYLYNIARVEEQRWDWPLAWVWRRLTAARLTWSSHRNHTSNWALWWWLPYAMAFGRVHTSRVLPSLLSEEELLRTFESYGRPAPLRRKPVSARQIAVSRLNRTIVR